MTEEFYSLQIPFVFPSSMGTLTDDEVHAVAASLAAILSESDPTDASWAHNSIQLSLVRNEKS